jgi:hypothetical protein
MWRMERRIAGGAAPPGLALAVGLALTLAGCASSQTQSATSTSASATSTSAAPHSAGAPHTSACAGSQLALADGGTEGATGHLELTVTMRNTSPSACVLRGYPRARLLNGAGRALPLRVARGHGFFPDSDSRPQQVSLRPGGSARFGLSFDTNNEYKGAHVCRTVAAAMVSTPGSPGHWQRVSLRSGPRIAPCGSRLVVSPIHE